MAKKNNEQQLKSQGAKKLNLSLEDKKRLSEMLKEVKEQTTFNTDPISELVEDGEIENAV